MALTALRDEKIDLFHVNPEFELNEETYNEFVKFQNTPLKMEIGNADDMCMFRIEKLEPNMTDESVKSLHQPPSIKLKSPDRF